MRLAALLLATTLLSGCGVPTGQPLLSPQSPAGTGLVGSANVPEPVNSLPPGAEGLHTPHSPFAFAPNYGSLTLKP